MKKLFSLFLFAIAHIAFAADAADDVILSQRNTANDDFVQRNVSPVANGVLAFDGSKVPTSTNVITRDSNGAVAVNAAGTNQPVTFTPSGTGFAQINSATRKAVFREDSSDGFMRLHFLASGTAPSSSNAFIAYGGGTRVFMNAPGASGTWEFQSNGSLLGQWGSSGLFLGTTTSSSNGILQLASHTTSAGGIGFGTDVTISRGSSAQVDVGIGGQVLRLFSSGTGIGVFSGNGGTGNGFLTDGSNNLFLKTNSTTGLTLDPSQNVITGPSGALATNAANGFLYVPSGAGTPTGTPTSITGKVPIYVDTTNHKLYFYSGGSWRDAGP